MGSASDSNESIHEVSDHLSTDIDIYLSGNNYIIQMNNLIRRILLIRKFSELSVKYLDQKLRIVLKHIMK
ncbi:hypothetical protein C1645_361526 [Glomus cerebriforme]|uniref:Uncharacterized protein n=1 Tax=Glomus cerebriforme TaxID=658196 RepID=A0A397SSQ9_9GLOM|nr:hypothetical protein C1645_361526 [Glomus cerebriforme]